MDEGISFLTLCKLLEKKKNIHLNLSKEAHAAAMEQYSKIRLYSHTELEDGVLYIREARCEGEVRGIVLTKDVQLATARDSSAAELYNAAISVFEEISDWKNRMQLASWMPEAISRIIWIAGEQLSHPMYVADPGYKIYAMSDHPDMYAMSYSWKYAFDQGYLPMDIILSLSKSQELKAGKYNNRAQITSSDSFYTRFTNYVITEDQTIHGHFFVIEIFSKFEEYEIELIQMVGNALRQALIQNTQFSVSSGSLYEHFIVDVLEGTLTNEDHIKSQLKALKLSEKQAFAILRIEPPQFDLSQLRSTCSIIEKKLSNALTVVHNKGITAVIYVDDDIKKDQLLQKIEEFLRSSGLTAGLSDVFYDFRHAPLGLDQADAALQSHETSAKSENNMSDKNQLRNSKSEGSMLESDKLKGSGLGSSKTEGNGNRLIEFNSISLEYLAHESARYFELDMYVYPGLLKIREYDVAHDTELIKTLRVLLENNQSLKLTAEQLFIHRNTLVKRVEKIEQIGRLDLAEVALVQRLTLSFAILDTQEEASITLD